MKPTVNQLKTLEPIRGLSESRLEELSELCQCMAATAGSDPLSTLAKSAQFIYLLSGELRLSLPDGGMQVLVGACDAANWPIGYKTAMPVRTRAITDVTLLSLDFDLLDRVMTWDEMSVVADNTATTPDSTAWSSMTVAFSAQALTATALARLPPAHIHELLKRFERMPAKRGQVIVNEGDDGDYYFLVESGRCTVSKRIGGVQMDVAELKTGDAFGEEALVSQSKRGASVSMKTDGVLLRLAKPDFVELLQEPLLRPITREEADARVSAGQSVWLDVRYPAEFTEDGLHGAINVPLNEVRSAVDVLDRSKEYIVYCQSGRRSSAAAFLLAQRGVNALWLKGGLGRLEAA